MTERVLEAIYEEEIKCKYTHCKVTGTIQQLYEHQKLCIAREISCPMKLQNACVFSGDAREFIRHIKTG